MFTIDQKHKNVSSAGTDHNFVSLIFRKELLEKDNSEERERERTLQMKA